jgi:hypothetical protein
MRPFRGGRREPWTRSAKCLQVRFGQSRFLVPQNVPHARLSTFASRWGETNGTDGASGPTGNYAAGARYGNASTTITSLKPRPST